MDSKLKEMFPAGEWGTGQRAWMVKDGPYFWAAAEIVDGQIVLTDFGKSKLAPAVRVPAPVVEVPVVEEPVSKLKKAGK